MAGKATPAVALLVGAGVAHTLHTYRHDPRQGSYGLAAAQALSVPPERVFKTLVATVDDGLTVGVVPVTGRLDLKALAAAAGGKRATMAEADRVRRATGYVLGGVSPLGLRSRLPVVLDSSMRRFPTVFCSGGRRGLELELAPDDLIRLSEATVADIAG